MNRLLPEDIDFVLREAAFPLETLRGKRVFVTGGTGFFGCWLLEVLSEANLRFQLGLGLTVLSRDPDRFQHRVPHLGNHREVKWVRGGILELSRDFVARQLGEQIRYDAVIHLVTEADLEATATAPLRAIEVIAEGTRRGLEFAVACEATRFLFTSSGAVYGPQPAGLAAIPETFVDAPETTDMLSAYGAAGNAKRYAELLCAAYAKQYGLSAVIARCFTFLGPHLPLRGKFAAGNFVGAALEGRNIIVNGDGTALRSYLYAADLTVWLLTLLVRGQAGRAYNVGSECPVSINALAEAVRDVSLKRLQVNVLGRCDSSKPLDRYLPATRRAAEELGLVQKISLESGLERTLRWHQNCLDSGTG